MSKKLYEITDEMNDLFDQVDPETGELPPQLALVTADFKSKAQSVVAYFLNEQADLEKLEELLKKLQAKKKRIEGRAQWFKNYLFDNMKRAGISKIEANDLSFKAEIKKDRDSYIEIYDEAQIPKRFMRIVPKKMEPDKKLIKEQILKNKEVKGARLVTKDRLEIK